MSSRVGMYLGPPQDPVTRVSGPGDGSFSHVWCLQPDLPALRGVEAGGPRQGSVCCCWPEAGTGTEPEVLTSAWGAGQPEKGAWAYMCVCIMCMHVHTQACVC